MLKAISSVGPQLPGPLPSDIPHRDVSSAIALDLIDLRSAVRRILWKDYADGFLCQEAKISKDNHRLEIVTQNGSQRRVYSVLQRFDDQLYVLFDNQGLIENYRKLLDQERISWTHLSPFTSQWLLGFTHHWLLFGLLVGLSAGFLRPIEPKLEKRPFVIRIKDQAYEYHTTQGYLGGLTGLSVAAVLWSPLFLRQLIGERKRVKANYRCPNCRKRTKCRVDYERSMDSPNCASCGYNLIGNCCWFCARRAAEPDCTVRFVKSETAGGQRKIAGGTEYRSLKLMSAAASRCGKCYRRHVTGRIACYAVPLTAAIGCYHGFPFFANRLPITPHPSQFSFAVATFLLTILPIKILTNTLCRFMGTYPLRPRCWSWPGRTARYEAHSQNSSLLEGSRTPPYLRMIPRR